MSYLPTILLIIAIASIWGVIVAISTAYRASQEARNTIFPVVREEAIFRGRWANLTAMLLSTFALFALIGWWFSSRNNGAPDLASTSLETPQTAALPVANTPESVAVLPVNTPQAASPADNPTVAAVLPGDNPTVIAESPATQPVNTEAAPVAPLDTATPAPLIIPTDTPPLPTDTPLPTITNTPIPLPTETNTPVPVTPSVTPTSVMVKVSTSVPSPTVVLAGTRQPVAANLFTTTAANSAAVTVTDPQVLAMLNVATVTQRVALVAVSATATPVPTAKGGVVLSSSVASTQPKLGPLIFTTSADSNLKVGQRTFNSDVSRVYAMFPYSDMQDGFNFRVIWYYQGKELWRDERPWQLGPAAQSFTYINNFGSGVYVVELYVNNLRVASGDFEIR